MLHTKWMRPFSTLLTILSVLLQPFAPLIALMPAAKVYAAENLSFTSHLEFKHDSNEFVLSQTDVESVQYTLTYERNSSDGVMQEALTGSVSGNNGIISKSIYAGTCSQQVCVPHEVVKGTLEVLAQDMQGQMRASITAFVVQDNHLWEHVGNSWSTEHVQLGTEYAFPVNSAVSLRFQTLPVKSGRITIQELKLSDEKAAELGAITSTAYDITSDMVDGTFAYTLSLPMSPDSKGLVAGVKPQDLKIAYSENGTDFTGEVSVSSKNATAVEATNLDHFTVFVLVNDKTNGGTSSTTDDVTNGVITSIQDAWISQSSSTQNNGDDVDLQVRSQDSNRNQRMLVKFDVSPVSTTSAVSKATLRLYMTSAPSSSRTYNAYRITSADWVEGNGGTNNSPVGEVRWDNQPSIAGSATASTNTGTSNQQWVEWDVTSDVSAFLAGTSNNYGWLIKDSLESSSSAKTSTFRSRENGTQNQRPQLVVDFATASAQPTLYNSPTAQSATTGGDGNGFESNASGAFADGGTYASNINGAGDRHIFSNYGFSFPSGTTTIHGVEVRADWFTSSTSGTNSMNVELSWDGGTTWTAAKTDSIESTKEHIVSFGGSSDSWGHTWSSSEFSNANFRVRVTMNSTGSQRDFYLDWIPVRVYYSVNSDTTPPAVPTHISPSNGVVMNSSSMMIDWSDVTDPSTPVTYYYQSSLSATTSGVLNSFTSPIYTSSALSASQIDASGSAENTYYWQVRSCDGAGNCSNWSAPWSVTVDNTAPTVSEVTAVSTPTNDATPNYTFSSSEAGTLAYSGGCSSATTSAVSGSNTITLNTLSDNTYASCQLTVTDAAGNTSAPMTFTSFMIDTALPVVSSPSVILDFGGTYVDGLSFIVRAAVADTLGGSGLDTATCEYTTDGSTWNSATYDSINTRCEATGLSSTDAYSLTLNVRVKDLAGNLGTGSSLSRTSDVNAPTLTAPSMSPDVSGVTSASPTISSTLSDSVSPVVSCELRYKKSADAWSLGSGWLSATFTDPTCTRAVSGLIDSGSYDFQMRATDTVGHIGESAITTMTIDDVAPTITVDSQLTNDTTPLLSGTVNDVAATVSAKVNGTTYTATNNGDGTWTVADNTIAPALAEGQYDVLVTATDPVGNAGTDATINELTIDTTKPVITVPSDFSAEATSPAGAFVSYTATALDDVDGALTPTCSPISGSQFAFGTTTVSCDVTDAAGNAADTTTFDITVEDTLNPSATLSSPLASSFHNAEFAVSGTATDSGSGVMDPDGIHVEFRKQSDDTLVDTFTAAYTATTSAYTVSILNGVNTVPDGLYKIVVTVEDNASHSTSVNVQNVTVDTTAPSSVITVPANSGDNGTVYTNSWTGLLSGTASDPASGSGVIKRVDLSIKRASDSAYWNGTAWVAGTDAIVRVTATGAEAWSYTLPSPLEGKYFITTHAVDMADNVENSYHLTIYYDLTLPLVWSTINPATPDASNDWYKTEPTITLLASDDILLNHIEYQWNGTSGAWTTYTAPFKTFGEGGYTVYFRAIDEATNVSLVGSRLVKFDKTELEYGPQNLSISPNPTSGTTALVKWDAAKDNVGISGYEIRWKLEGLSTEYSKSVGSDIREFTIDKLTEGTWKVTVRAFDDAGHNKDATINEIVDRTAPQAPVLSMTGKGTGTVNLAWSAVSDAKDYVVLYGNESGKYLYGAHVGNVTTFTVNGLGAGNYFFIARALDAADNQSPNSNEVSTGTVVGAPGVEPGAPAQGFSPDVLGQTTENTDESGSTEQPSVLGATCQLNWIQRWIPFFFTRDCTFEWLWLLTFFPIGAAGWLFLKKKNE